MKSRIKWLFYANKNSKRKIFLRSYSKKIHHFMMDFFTGKNRDLGLKFSHETPKVAAGGLAYKGNFFFLNFLSKKFIYASKLK